MKYALLIYDGPEWEALSEASQKHRPRHRRSSSRHSRVPRVRRRRRPAIARSRSACGRPGVTSRTRAT